MLANILSRCSARGVSLYRNSFVASSLGNVIGVVVARVVLLSYCMLHMFSGILICFGNRRFSPNLGAADSSIHLFSWKGLRWTN